MNERLKSLRKYNHLSQEDFGKRIGIGKTSVSKLESGENNPSEQTLLLICKEFNVNYFWLTEGKGDMLTGTPQTVIEEIAEKYNLDELDQKILAKFLELKPEERKVIKDYMKSIFT